MISEFIKVTIFIILFIPVITLIGRKIIRPFGTLEEDPWFINALSYLVGLAAFVYGLVFLGLLGLFSFWPIGAYLIFLVSIPLFEVQKLRYSALIDSKTNLSNIFVHKKGLVFLLVFLGMVNYVASFTPPFAWDEVAYHLPEARWIISQGKITFPVNGHPFYGNLPVSMEVLYAFSLLFSGYSLVHVMHYTFLLSLLILVYSFLKKRYSPKVGLLASIFIFFLSGFVENATTGYIDAASTVFEITALLLMIGWLEKENDNYLYLSGLFYGLSLSVKYTPLYSLIGYMLILGLTVFIGEKHHLKDLPKIIFKFSLFAFIGGGFWYMKNLILYGNPIYPFIFGHPGLNNEELEGIKGSITQFVTPRDLTNFIKIPYTFFLSRMGSLENIFVFFSFILAPLALLNKRSLRVTVILLCVGFFNLALWFFAITHQTRFLFSTLVILTILSGIAFSRLGLTKGKVLVPVLIVLIIGNYFFQIAPGRFVLRAIYTDLIKAQEMGLLIGKISKTDYLAQKLGNFIYITDYINKNYSDQTVINFWNHNAHFYLEKGNSYTQESPNDVSEYPSFLNNKKIKLLAVDYAMKRAFIYNPNWSSWRAPRLDFEQYFINNAYLIYRYRGGALYRIK